MDTSFLLEIKKKIEAVQGEYNCRLLNRYRSGSDSMAYDTQKVIRCLTSCVTDIVIHAGLIDSLSTDNDEFL